MTTFLYDGSFEGLLSCIYETYRQSCQPTIVATDKHQEELFTLPQTIPTSPEQAERVTRKLQAISQVVFRTVQYCYLSNHPQKENLILAYIRQALLHGTSVNRRYADADIGTVLDCTRSVGREAHRFKGFLRFQELQDNYWYAGVEPDNCIVPLLAEHCRERFPEQQWIIHDTKRDIALIYTNKQTTLYTHTELQDIHEHLSFQEKQYQALWKTFFKNIAILERKNPKLQQQFMPKKYWKYLVEKKGEG
jgi:probable DNA metabolism protein